MTLFFFRSYFFFPRAARAPRRAERAGRAAVRGEERRPAAPPRGVGGGHGSPGRFVGRSEGRRRARPPSPPGRPAPADISERGESSLILLQVRSSLFHKGGDTPSSVGYLTRPAAARGLRLGLGLGLGLSLGLGLGLGLLDLDQLVERLRGAGVRRAPRGGGGERTGKRPRLFGGRGRTDVVVGVDPLVVDLLETDDDRVADLGLVDGGDRAQLVRPIPAGSGVGGGGRAKDPPLAAGRPFRARPRGGARARRTPGARDSGRRMRTTEPFSTARGVRRCVLRTPRAVESWRGATRALAVATRAARITTAFAIWGNSTASI